jgi:glycosyltransferase involved in cell wall biosynthesis
VERVSVVVPNHNRGHCIARAVGSALGQTRPPLEVIVVDDGSTDGSREAVESLRDPRVRWIEHGLRRNAAAARNTGLDAAVGDFVAFLDSDDEWLPGHLDRRLDVLAATGAAGVCGSFRIVRGRLVSDRICPAKPEQMSMAEYTLSGRGDARSSTFVFRRDAVAQVRFDEGLRKHQDWDFAARFSERFQLVCDPVVTAVLHVGGQDRMTERLDHAATRVFCERYEPTLTGATAARFYSVLALRTIRAEGRTPEFYDYLQRASRYRHFASPRIRLALAALAVPGVATLFARAQRAYVRSRSTVSPSLAELS